MSKAIHNLRLFLCTFSGEDDYIIRRCEAGIQISFALIGLFVMLVFIGCWASASLFMSHLFEDSIWMSGFVGIIWALLVTNLYLLLLYTISPALLPITRHGKKKDNSFKNDKIGESEKPESAFTSSFIFRLLLITLLAITTTQPFNVFIFSNSNNESEKYAETLRNLFSKHPSSWLVTIVGCIIFLLPVYWKYAIRNRGGFYEKKRHIENKFVHDNYSDFKEVYASVFTDKVLSYNRQTWENIMPVLNKLEKADTEMYKLRYESLKSEIINETIAKYEYWADHPFRTIHKKAVKNLSSEEDFLKDIYSENI
jgi:hypothetical protein